MTSRKIVGLLAAAAMAMSGPAAAQQSAQALSVANSPSVRASAAMDDESNMRGRLLPAIAIVALIIGILALTDTWPFDEPDSP